MRIWHRASVARYSPFMLATVPVCLVTGADRYRVGALVGAIRWDAWHGDASSVGLTVEKTLARHTGITGCPSMAR